MVRGESGVFFFFLSILVKCFRKTRQTDDRKREKEGT